MMGHRSTEEMVCEMNATFNWQANAPHGEKASQGAFIANMIYVDFPINLFQSQVEKY
jgi:hypothetical protein